MTPYRICPVTPTTCNDRTVPECVPQPSPWLRNGQWIARQVGVLLVVGTVLAVPGFAGGLAVASLSHPRIEVEPQALLRAATRPQPRPVAPRATADHVRLTSIISVFPATTADSPDRLLRMARAMEHAGLDIDVEEISLSDDARDDLSDDSFDDVLSNASLEYADTAILVSHVSRKSALAKAGFKNDDLIVTINGRRVGDDRFFEMRDHLAVIELVRDGHRRVHAIRWR